jgi:coenzyme F420-reducing hydrogenase delta subunit
MSDAVDLEITVLYCGRGLEEGGYVSEETKQGAGFRARFVMMPCTGKVEVGYLMKLIEKGVDGVQIVGCPEKMCRFLVGSNRAEKRVRFAGALLEEAGIGSARLGMARVQGLSVDQMMALAQERAEAVRPLGQNPMKAVGASAAP